MLQGKYSARGGPIKGRTATLMFSRNNQKNSSGSIIFFLEEFFFQNYPKIGP
jgi:hypothetical protein